MNTHSYAHTDLLAAGVYTHTWRTHTHTHTHKGARTHTRVHKLTYTQKARSGKLQPAKVEGFMVGTVRGKEAHARDGVRAAARCPLTLCPWVSWFTSDEYYRNATSLPFMENVLVLTMPDVRHYKVDMDLSDNTTVVRAAMFNIQMGSLMSALFHCVRKCMGKCFSKHMQT